MPAYSGRIDVALDPGHSRADPGATGGGLVEHELTLAAGLEGAGQAGGARPRGGDDAHRRPTADGLQEPRRDDPHPFGAGGADRRWGRARVYVSLHFNGNNDPRVGGSSVYYNPENHGPASQRLAALLQQEIVARVREATGYPLRDIGVLSDLTAGKPYGHFFSLRGPFPSALVEAMFLTNPREAALLADEATLDALADAYAVAIQRYLQAAGEGIRGPVISAQYGNGAPSPLVTRITRPPDHSLYPPDFLIVASQWRGVGGRRWSYEECASGWTHAATLPCARPGCDDDEGRGAWRLKSPKEFRLAPRDRADRLPPHPGLERPERRAAGLGWAEAGRPLLRAGANCAGDVHRAAE